MTRKYRPLPESSIKNFGQWITSEDWSVVFNKKTISDKVNAFQSILTEKVDLNFPEKSVRMRDTDLPFITSELKSLDRRKKRAYRKNKKSDKYFQLKREYDLLFKNTASNYFANTVKNLLCSKPGKAYTVLKKLGARPGEFEELSSFDLQNHVDQNFTPKQSADAIANHFAAVSQKFPAFNINSLPLRVRIILEEQQTNKPKLSEKDVWEVMRKSKITKSVVAGDIPGRLNHEFAPELALPASDIHNDIINTGQWPEQWKTEVGIPK